MLTILVSLLGQVVSQPSIAGSLRSRLNEICREISRRYLGEEFKCSAKVAASFAVLRNLLYFFDQYHNKEYQQALKVSMHTLKKA